MKKYGKQIIIGLVIVVVLYTIFKVWKGKKQNSLPAPSNVPVATASYTSPAGGSTSEASGCTNSSILKKGSKCDRVQWSQYKINQVASKLGIAKLTEDSVFGSKTEAAFQKLLGKKTGSWNEVLSKVNSIK